MSAREIGDVVDDLVGVWHDTEPVNLAVGLAAFLGMEDDEYDAWAQAPSSYPDRLHGYARWLHERVGPVVEPCTCGHARAVHEDESAACNAGDCECDEWWKS